MTTRRAFLKTSAALALAAANYDRVFGANEVLNVGCVGTGGRCRQLMKSLVKVPDVRITAVCDVWDVSLAEGLTSGRVYSIGEDRQERLWIGTGDGVDVIMAQGTDHFDESDGMSGDGFTSSELADAFIRFPLDADTVHRNPERSRHIAAHRLDVWRQLRSLGDLEHRRPSPFVPDDPEPLVAALELARNLVPVAGPRAPDLPELLVALEE